MTYLSILEKLKILFNMLWDFKVVLIFVSLMIALTGIYMIKKISTKKYGIFMTLMFIMLFAISIISNHRILLNTFDDFTTIFFSNIYFPSIYIYIALLVLVDLIFIISLLSKKIRKAYKIINSIVFILNNIIFAVVLNIIAKNKIDVFSVTSLYTNINLVAVLEISINLVILWILSLLVIYITNNICDRIKANKEVKVENIIQNNYTEVVEDNVIENKYASNNEVKESGIILKETPNALVVDNIESNKIEKNSITFEDILNGTVPVTYYESAGINTSKECNIVNPQEIYEKKYKNKLNEIEEEKINDITVVEESTINKNEKEEVSENIKDKKYEEKKKKIEDNLKINTIPLTDVSENKSSVTFESIACDIDKESIAPLKNISSDKYTLEDYKKMIKMLEELKNHTRYNSMSIDDAVAISLISNYSFDDCRKFKEILESNLN